MRARFQLGMWVLGEAKNGGSEGAGGRTWKMNGLTAHSRRCGLLADMPKRVRLGCDVMLAPDTPPTGRVVFSDFATTKPRGPIPATYQTPAHRPRRSSSANRAVANPRLNGRAADAVTGRPDRHSLLIGETLEEREAGAERARCGLFGLAHRCPRAAAMRIPSLPAGLGHRHRPQAEVHRQIGRCDLYLKSRWEAGGVDLYGGSSPTMCGNCSTGADVNGALVGGASLKAADFIGIIQATPEGRNGGRPPLQPSGIGLDYADEIGGFEARAADQGAVDVVARSSSAALSGLTDRHTGSHRPAPSAPAIEHEIAAYLLMHLGHLLGRRRASRCRWPRPARRQRRYRHAAALGQRCGELGRDHTRAPSRPRAPPGSRRRR